MRHFQDKYGLVGNSRAIQGVREAIDITRYDTMPVLIRGESGVGKELVARAIHTYSKVTGPLVVINIAAVPTELLESSLYGHTRGSFTGAVTDKPGRIAAANKGTLFLDEIGDLPVSLQVKLLRFLSEKEVARIGDDRTLYSDVRLVSATHKNLEHMMEKGEFREDFFHRLNAMTIYVPPLRERREDIPALAAHFVNLYLGDGYTSRPLVVKDLQKLMEYDWRKNNVRELENVIRTAVSRAKSEQLGDRKGTIHLSPDYFGIGNSAAPVVVNLAPPNGTKKVNHRRISTLPSGTTTITGETEGITLDGRLDNDVIHLTVNLPQGTNFSAISLKKLVGDSAESLYLQSLLHSHKFNRALVARLTGLSYKTLLYKIGGFTNGKS